MKTLSLLLISSGLAVGAVTTSLAATTPDTPHTLLPSAPRTVVIRETETPPIIRAGLLQSTLILLPAEEKVATVFGGDTVSWVFDGGHVAIFGGGAGATASAQNLVTRVALFKLRGGR
jgi:hypothetical protein